MSGFSRGTRWTGAQQYQILLIKNYKTKHNQKKKKKNQAFSEPVLWNKGNKVNKEIS